MRLRLALAALIAASGSVGAETAAERGGYLVNALAACAGCHTPKRPPGPLLSGGDTFGAQGVVAANITPDKDTGIGAWTDRQIIDAVRDGVRPDGSRLAQPMPQWAYRSMSDADVAAIVAYLRTVPPVHHRTPVIDSRQPRAPRPFVASVAAPPSDTPLARGRYIANALSHCTECHTPGPPSEPDVTHHLDEGGRMFTGPKGPVTSPSITAASLSRYSDAALTLIITQGVRPDGSKLDGPMPVKSYAKLKTTDLTDLIAYLRDPVAPSSK